MYNLNMDIIKKYKEVLLMVEHKDCNKCKIMYPIIDNLSNDHNIFIIDVDKNKIFINGIDIKNEQMPVFLYFNDGVFIKFFDGIKTKEELLEIFN